VEFAIWLHDAVYIPQRADNEVRSARWAGALLQRWQVRADWRSWVVSAILATQHGGDRTANQAANQVPNQATRSAGIAKPIGSEGLNCDSLPHTNPLSHPKLSPDRDRALMLDLDLSILAAPAPVFARYEAAIRDEYRYVSDEAFRLGRLAVLRSFLDRDRLFQSDIGLIRFEAQARQNLATAIARLDPLNPS
jgi:predicted metal-dependent HD superfamily phosphohydrolase